MDLLARPSSPRKPLCCRLLHSGPEQPADRRQYLGLVLALEEPRQPVREPLTDADVDAQLWAGQLGTQA